MNSEETTRRHVHALAITMAGSIAALSLGCGSNSVLNNVAEKVARNEFRVVVSPRSAIAGPPGSTGGVQEVTFTATALCKEIHLWSPCVGPVDYQPRWRIENSGSLKVERVGDPSPQQLFRVTLQPDTSAATSSTVDGGAYRTRFVWVFGYPPLDFKIHAGPRQNYGTFTVKMLRNSAAKPRKDLTPPPS